MRGNRAVFLCAVPAVLLAACGATPAATGGSAHRVTASLARDPAASSSAVPPRRLAQVVARARAIYGNEINGPRVHYDTRLVAGDQVLLNDLARGDLAAAQAQAHYDLTSNPGDHITRISVVRGSRQLVNAVWNKNGSFVVAPLRHRLYLHGRSLGTLLVSVQDVVGYVKLVHVFTGAWAVARGSSGQVRASLHVGGSLPRSGSVTIAGHRYAVASFGVGGWPTESLTVWVLAPA